MKGKIALLLVISLFFGMLSVSVTAPSTKTIDGDPSDWTGIAGGDNTFVGHSGEGIWNDLAFDDTGNGSIIYPNCTHDPPPGPDSAGAPWAPYDSSYKALAYTDKFGGSGVEPYWYKHGGMVDLREFRVTADSSFLYIMVRYENMGNTAIAKEWGGNNSGFGSKAFCQVYIDKDRVSGSGNTTATMNGNFEFAATCRWEVVIDITDDALGVRKFPRVQLANGTWYNHTTDGFCRGNPDIYPSAIEMKVPFSEIGDPRGQTWRFVVVVGGYDEGNWRQVTDASLSFWFPLFRFCGGEGGDPPAMGRDSNIIDMAFTASQAEQEALLDSFSSLVQINKYQDITFDGNGNVKTTGVGGEVSALDKLALMAPWIAIAAIVIVASASVIFYRKRTLKTL